MTKTLTPGPISNALLIYNRCILAGFPRLLSLFIVAQSKHETAVGGEPYKSKLFLRSWNAFGYGYLKHDPDQVGPAGRHPEDGGVYAKYVDLDHCMNDIIQWYKKRSALFLNVKTVLDFVVLLKQSGYFTAPIGEYKAGVSRFYEAGV